MNMDRKRDPDPAANIEAQNKAQQEKLWQVQALGPKVWRTLSVGEKAALTSVCVTHTKNDDECVPLSVFAVVKPLYDRIVDMMSSSGHLHHIHVDQSEFNHQN
jgi:hypothetical protein